MSINLLPHKKQTFAEKFFSWMLTFGRFIIIGVELVVLIAFLSRFKLDRDIIDLHEKIQHEEASVKSLSNVEKKSRDLEVRLFQISKLDRESKNTISILSQIPALVPDTVFLDGLTIDENNLKIDARALTGGGLSSFVKRLRDSPHFSDVILDNVSRDEILGGQIKFTITANSSYADTNK